MDIKQIRHIVNMSQRSFAEFFGIPVGTLRNWEQGISRPPDYVLHMILNSIRRDMMINVETIKFINMLNELAKLSANGIDEFGNATEENFRSKIFYDKKTVNEDGYYSIVADARIMDDPVNIHHEINEYYGNDTNEFDVYVVLDEINEPYVLIKFAYSEEVIYIENGCWRFD